MSLSTRANMNRSGKLSSLIKKVKGHQGMIIGSVIVITVIAIALLAPLIAPHDPYHQDLMRRLVPPVWDSRGSWEHILGTDHLGRDYLSRLIYGARISLLIGIGAAVISGIIGTFMGVMGGYFAEAQGFEKDVCKAISEQY